MQPAGLNTMANGFHLEIAGATRRKNVAQSQRAEIREKDGHRSGKLTS
jgi:hypothetical protein